MIRITAKGRAFMRGWRERDVFAQEIVDDMQTALDQFSAVMEGFKG
jgi:hypothetical protein